MNIAVITARGGSKRIPRKNIRNFCGKPIIAYSIEAAKNTTCFDEIYVSTDDPEISKVALSLGAKVPFSRSAKNSDDHSTTAEVMVEFLTKIKEQGHFPEAACCIYPTAPFLTSQVLQKGFDILSSTAQATSVFPVARFSYPIQRALKMKGDKVTMFQPEHLLSRSQDLEPAYHDAGQFYWLNVNSFLKNPQLFNANSYALPLPESAVQDIDTEEDWTLAELKFKKLQQEHKI